ncbi:MAG: serine/threonine protein kinase [Planctomycetota bacterium]
MSDERKAKEIFQEALEKPLPERKAFLDGACTSPVLRQRVDALLAAYDGLGDFLSSPTAANVAEAGPGTMVGPYKLLQQIGEGGFGVVYMAEQTRPVRRKVALKIVRLGMDTRQVIARFEAERQALALMDHPNIAKVLDAGATETGRPYFVMELVKGIPITEYCDQAHLDTGARLDLFQKVCHAVQHAHQKGIIHRDLKPSNILVTLHDGNPVPKVIDFGIAKATDRRLTEKTLFTEFRQMIGTPEYMAPEQAELSGLDIDTRADVYSLGVLLYELLTGTKPFDLGTLLDKGYDEILRTIREVDPPRPSTRVSTMGNALVTVAAKRQTPPRLLGRILRGDLDWIVMKALEKDRSRRYETASSLAADIGRYLLDEAVLASPPGALYRVGKYVRRHRVGVAAAAAVFAALVVSGGLAYLGMREAETVTKVARGAEAERIRHRDDAREMRERELAQRRRAEAGAEEARRETARANAVLGLVNEMLGSADPHRARGAGYTVRQLLDDFGKSLGDRQEGQPEVDTAVRLTMVRAYLGLSLPDRAEPLLLRTWAQLEPAYRGEVVERIAKLYEASGRPEKAAEWRTRR